MGMSKIVVVSVDGRLADIRLPFSKDRLEAIADGSKAVEITYDEERSMLKWMKKVSAGRRPIDEEQLDEILENRNDPRTVAEDREIAAWILTTWKAIEESVR